MKATVLIGALIVVLAARSEAQVANQTPDCRPGTQRATQAVGPLLLPPGRYCSDPMNYVQDVRRAAGKVYWRVPLMNGAGVACECMGR